MSAAITILILWLAIAWFSKESDFSKTRLFTLLPGSLAVIVLEITLLNALNLPWKTILWIWLMSILGFLITYRDFHVSFFHFVNRLFYLSGLPFTHVEIYFLDTARELFQKISKRLYFWETLDYIQLITRIIGWVIFFITVGYIVYWAVNPYQSPPWAGFGPYDASSDGPRAKTLWDWMELLIIPVVLSMGVWFLNKTEKENERKITQKKTRLEREVAEESRQETRLQACFDRMSELLLRENLGSSSKDDLVRAIAQTWTTTIFQSLNGERKGIVLSFLYDAGLLDKERTIISLKNANLREVQIQNMELPEINLSETTIAPSYFYNKDTDKTIEQSPYIQDSNLTRASFQDAKIFGAIIREVNFQGTDFRNTTIEGTHFVRVDFKDADFSNAKLIEVTFDNVDFTNAKISLFDFHRCKLRGENILPDGSKSEP